MGEKLTDLQLQELEQIPLDTRKTIVDLRTGQPYSVALGWLCHAAANEIRKLRIQCLKKHNNPNPEEE
jgi:hypothetical protein